MLVLILSDVIGDPLPIIASGPTVPCESSFAGCLDILQKYALTDIIPASVLNRLTQGSTGLVSELPGADDECFRKITNILVGSNRIMLESARQYAESTLDYRTQIHSDRLAGDAFEAGRAFASLALELPAGRHCVLAGGETTVLVRGSGKGGRCQVFAIAAAEEFQSFSFPVLLLAAGSDGQDGPTDAAGAFADNSTIARARELGLDATAFLDNSDSYHFLEALGSLFKPGLTGTNVMDIFVMLVIKP
eukprot:m.732789 g.732789  ORF g.732789 m.732789 type:complete len:248 (-) comp58873_c0_seq10:2199-2942(-)